MTEHQHQAALFRWAKLQGYIYPDLKLMFAIPNGGHRHKAVAAKLNAEGVKSGVPDIFLPIARNGFHGLFIELKKPKDSTPQGKLTKSQVEWLMDLGDRSYATTVCFGWESAKETIEAYLKDDT